MIATRRQFLGAAALGAGAQSPAGARPNVLVFMSDQESAMIPGPVKLVNRKRLERTSAVFTNAFCNTPQCSAARSSLLTGLEPHKTGVLTNVDAGSLGKPLPQSLASVGTVFSGAGYATGYFGKWHLGGTPHGFSFATPERGKDPDIVRAAAGWIREQKQPWLAWVSVINPHDIYSVRNMLNMKPRERVTLPASDLRNLAGKPAEQQEYVDRDQGKITRDFTPDQWRMYRSYYCDLVEKVDDCLGQVLAAVDLGSTVIAYTSDHGDALGEHGLPFKGPFMYEALVRIPFMIHDPRRLKARTRREELITQTDLAPTLAASAGIQWPGRVDGVDLLSGPVKRDAVFLEYYAKQKWVNPIRTIRTAEWKLNLYDSGNRELYHLASDPHEIRNLAGSKDAAVTERRLEERLNGWRGPMERNVRRD